MSGLARRQLTLDNAVAAELAGSEDAVLRALRGHMGDVDFHLRGNVLTLDGDSGDVTRGWGDQARVPSAVCTLTDVGETGERPHRLGLTLY